MGVQAKLKEKKKEQGIHIDMTPMVDLGFLLITFFILTTTMNQPNTIDMKLPAKPDQPTEQPEIDLSNSISVLLGKDNRIYYHQFDESGLTDPSKLQETTFDTEGIERVIDQAKARAKKPDIFTVIIKPTEDSNYENFVNILDEMEITKTDHYGITDVKPWEQKIYEAKVGESGGENVNSNEN